MNLMKNAIFRFSVLITISLISFSCKKRPVESISLGNLRCEMLINPEGIDNRNPGLSWEIVSGQRNILQKAYHIIVSSTPERLAENEGDLWNSGRIESNQSIHVQV